MTSPKREGAILFPAKMCVRLRHEPDGFYYQLHEASDGTHYEVTRVDKVQGTSEPIGRILRGGAKLTPEKVGKPKFDDALLMIARAWSRLPLLKPNRG